MLISFSYKVGRQGTLVIEQDPILCNYVKSYKGVKNNCKNNYGITVQTAGGRSTKVE